MSRRAAAGDSAAEERDGAEVEVQQMEMALDDDGLPSTHRMEE